MSSGDDNDSYLVGQEITNLFQPTNFLALSQNAINSLNS